MATFIKINRMGGAGAQPATGFAGVLQSIMRFGLIIVSAIVGIGVLLLTASAALVLVISIAIIGVLVFAWFWARAKFFGKPFGGQAFADMRSAAKQQSAAFEQASTGSPDVDGDIIDAHKTPDGWTVNE